VVLPWRRPGVTATSCVPCHCAAGGVLALSPVEPVDDEFVCEFADGLDEFGFDESSAL
jgi:hypothetical protein